MHKSILHFHFSRQGVHFSACFFLVGLHLARELGPPPGVASAVPASSRGGVCKIETQALSPRWYRFLITTLYCTRINHTLTNAFQYITIQCKNG